MKEQWRFFGRRPVWYMENEVCYVWVCRNPLDSKYTELFHIQRIDTFWPGDTA